MTDTDRKTFPGTPRWRYKGVPVPYIAAWSAELATDIASNDLILRTNPFTGQAQVRYRDEDPIDRDRHGILWHRVANAPGHGKPMFAEIHTHRQRRAMSRALCQICIAPAELWMTPEMLWKEHQAKHGPGAPYPTFDPPVCRNCAEMAARHCPELGRGHLYLAPRAWAITAVRGQVADPVHGGFSQPRTLALPNATRTPDHTALRLILAKGLIATLYGAEPHRAPDAVPGLGYQIAEPADTAAPSRPR